MPSCARTVVVPRDAFEEAAVATTGQLHLELTPEQRERFESALDRKLPSRRAEQ